MCVCVCLCLYVYVNEWVAYVHTCIDSVIDLTIIVVPLETVIILDLWSSSTVSTIQVYHNNILPGLYITYLLFIAMVSHVHTQASRVRPKHSPSV